MVARDRMVSEKIVLYVCECEKDLFTYVCTHTRNKDHAVVVCQNDLKMTQ